MSKQQTQLTALVLPAAGSDGPAFSSILKKYLFHWPLFVLGAALCLAGAYLYLKMASPVYPITATLKFKTPTTASGAPLTINDNSLDQLDPVNNAIIVENEIEVMQSKKLIYQVVKDLQLWVNYSIKKGLTTTDLYNKAPVYFSFTDSAINLSPAGDKLDIIVKDNRSFVLKDEKAGDKTCAFSTPVKSAFGTWKLDPTPNLPNFLGSPLSIRISDPDLVSDSYQGGIKVELEDKNAPFVNLSMSDAVPARGKDILNALMALYRLNAQAEKNEQTQKILVFVSGRVDSLKQDLDANERELKDYKRSEGITDIDAQAEGYRSLKNQNINAINNVDVQLSTLASLDRYARTFAYTSGLPPGSETLPDQSLVALYNRLVDLQLEKAHKAAITPLTNPLFVPLDSGINALKTDFGEKVESIRAALEANRRQLQSFDQGINSSLSKIPDWQLQFTNLNRGLESKQNIYKFLSSKKEEVALRFASLIQDSEIVDDAHAGAVKWPKSSIVYPLAFMMGLIAAAGFIYTRDSLNDLITNRRQVEDETGVPVLGELAYQDSTDPIVINSGQSRFVIGEQFRVLRTNLYHLLSGAEKGRVTLFTSSISGEGKSFVSANLAVTLAYASRRTILLEMDLRKPKVSAMFGLPPDKPGISNYLNGEAGSLQSLIQPSGYPGLDILGCGALLPNPSELLGRAALDDLINELKVTYDDILIDSPPIHLVTDSLVIGRVADACLYIVRQGYTHKSELDFIKELNTGNRFTKFTIVFNGVKRDGNGYGYGNYGYNQYSSYSGKQRWSLGNSIRGFLKRF